MYLFFIDKRNDDKRVGVRTLYNVRFNNFKKLISWTKTYEQRKYIIMICRNKSQTVVRMILVEI